MNSDSHWIEADVRYLTTEEGGRRRPVSSGYRGQFHYEGEHDRAFDGFQYFPDFSETELVPMGMTIRTRILFLKVSWDKYHSNRMLAGMKFQIQEGRKIVGHGVITKLSV